ncbi:hypothetical protein [Paraburkholderia sp. C35]|uniref:hypothetical protein n=1 Tax=Paraburkholderia sp. C35 TaxID=2126993 RepID=UPI0013A57E0D|nr:hypothetical protein [Paraburkholderia sp. C35]
MTTTRYLCSVCSTPHKRQHHAVECCSTGKELTADELESIGQTRLFDDGPPPARPVAVEPDGQTLLF